MYYITEHIRHKGTSHSHTKINYRSVVVLLFQIHLA